MPHVPQDELFDVIPSVQKGAHITTVEEYEKLHKQSLEDPDTFWRTQAKTLDWFQPFTKVQSGGFEKGDIAWFIDGKLNVSYNCIDRHLPTRGDKVAILWEGDEVHEVRKITYAELHREVCRYANLLKSEGLRKGDTVGVYLPNVPEAAYVMLACARLGLVHSVIFAGFSAEAVAARVEDAKCSVVFTADEGRRGGRNLALKSIVDNAVDSCSFVQRVFVLRRGAESKASMKQGRDVWLNEAIPLQSSDCPAEPLDSEDPLFLLYTSGSTGKPKGVMHTQAGYLLQTSLSHKYVFDYREEDVYACAADVGWITGHSYIVYGPLCNGATTFMFEGTPVYPNAGRYWDMVSRHKITQFYTAPTAIRTLMKFGADHVTPHDKSSLRILGTVGEPINPEAWRWYHNVVGNRQCAIVDTYWQTETGAHIITPLPGVTSLKPGSATFPFFGIKPVLLDPQTGKRIEPVKGKGISGVLAIEKPWPSIARSIFGDHQRYLHTYMAPYPGFYFTGDGARVDKDGYLWIEGRVDDVINVSGHRLGTAELESALVGHPSCAEAAVVGFPHDIKGQGIMAYCTMKDGVKVSVELENELKAEVRKVIGPFATPDCIIITPGLPKTRSGKIMRRILRKIAAKESSPDQLGDISTLAEPDIVNLLIQKVEGKFAVVAP